jgi:hypothetical protein
VKRPEVAEKMLPHLPMEERQEGSFCSAVFFYCAIHNSEEMFVAS